MSLTQKRSRDDRDDDETEYSMSYRPSFKQMKLADANVASMNEVAMSDAQSYVPFPTLTRTSSSSGLSIYTNAYPSPNYTLSSLQYPSTPASSYPTFELYPEVDAAMEVDSNNADSPIYSPSHQHSSSTDSTDSRLGLLQPAMGSTALQHGSLESLLPLLPRRLPSPLRLFNHQHILKVSATIEFINIDPDNLLPVSTSTTSTLNPSIATDRRFDMLFNLSHSPIIAKAPKSGIAFPPWVLRL
ncbi:hypothetical protein FRB96_005495 [Tulasnella sp. 330]|nr:hypothetical protein FRB96_005495 [Tulasnella sp. 330]